MEKLEAEYGISLSARQKHQVRLYVQMLQHWSRRINLTALERTEEILRRHFFESFWVAERFLGRASSLVDIGSGAGFPGMAFKLYRPGLALGLIEKSLKKTVFLKEVVRRLELQVEIFQGNAQDYAHWERWETASLRALKPSPELLERLAGAGCRLLLLHGSKPDPALRGWTALRSEKLPHSLRLQATLLAPPGEGAS